MPALLLQPLVENAVKHGIAGLVEGGAIRLAAKRQAGGGVDHPRKRLRPGQRRAAQAGAWGWNTCGGGWQCATARKPRSRPAPAAAFTG